MKEFIKIKGERIRKNTIKKYAPFEQTRLNVYYNTSRYKIELQTFNFDYEKERDEILTQLDLNFGLID